MVGEKETERGDVAERSGQAPAKPGIEGFAVVLEEPQIMALGEIAHDVERAGVAQDTDPGNGTGAGC